MHVIDAYRVVELTVQRTQRHLSGSFGLCSRQAVGTIFKRTNQIFFDFVIPDLVSFKQGLDVREIRMTTDMSVNLIDNLFDLTPWYRD